MSQPEPIADRFTDAELTELLVAILMRLRPDRDPEEARQLAAQAAARRRP
jgi:hypothetical protein